MTGQATTYEIIVKGYQSSNMLTEDILSFWLNKGEYEAGYSGQPTTVSNRMKW